MEPVFMKTIKGFSPEMDVASVLKFHDCAELPQLENLENDEDCLDRVRSIFHSVEWVGAGAFGFALKGLTYVKEPPHLETIIIKIARQNSREIRISCQLNTLLNETPIFPHTYGYLICKKLPQEWSELLKLKEPNHPLNFQPFPPSLPFMFMFLQPVPTTFMNAPLFLDHGYRVTLFFLLHGLYIARKQMEFEHNDIHRENVMMQPNFERQILHYQNWEIHIEARWIPRLIDYGKATITTQGGVGSTNKSVGKTFHPDLTYDLHNLQELFFERLFIDSQTPDFQAKGELKALEEFLDTSRFSSISWKSGADIILPLLNHPYFDVDEIQRRQIKRSALSPLMESEIMQHKRCFHCCTPISHYQVNHKQADTKYFCTPDCYASIHGAIRFVK